MSLEAHLTKPSHTGDSFSDAIELIDEDDDPQPQSMGSTPNSNSRGNLRPTTSRSSAENQISPETKSEDKKQKGRCIAGGHECTRSPASAKIKFPASPSITDARKEPFPLQAMQRPISPPSLNSARSTDELFVLATAHILFSLPTVNVIHLARLLAVHIPVHGKNAVEFVLGLLRAEVEIADPPRSRSKSQVAQQSGKGKGNSASTAGVNPTPQSSNTSSTLRDTISPSSMLAPRALPSNTNSTRNLQISSKCNATAGPSQRTVVSAPTVGRTHTTVTEPRTNNFPPLVSAPNKPGENTTSVPPTASSSSSTLPPVMVVKSEHASNITQGLPTAIVPGAAIERYHVQAGSTTEHGSHPLSPSIPISDNVRTFLELAAGFVKNPAVEPLPQPIQTRPAQASIRATDLPAVDAPFISRREPVSVPEAYASGSAITLSKSVDSQKPPPRQLEGTQGRSPPLPPAIEVTLDPRRSRPHLPKEDASLPSTISSHALTPSASSVRGFKETLDKCAAYVSVRLPTVPITRIEQVLAPLLHSRAEEDAMLACIRKFQVAAGQNLSPVTSSDPAFTTLEIQGKVTEVPSSLPLPPDVDFAALPLQHPLPWDTGTLSALVRIGTANVVYNVPSADYSHTALFLGFLLAGYGPRAVEILLARLPSQEEEPPTDECVPLTLALDTKKIPRPPSPICNVVMGMVKTIMAAKAGLHGAHVLRCVQATIGVYGPDTAQTILLWVENRVHDAACVSDPGPLIAPSKNGSATPTKRTRSASPSSDRDGEPETKRMRSESDSVQRARSPIDPRNSEQKNATRAPVLTAPHVDKPSGSSRQSDDDTDSSNSRDSTPESAEGRSVSISPSTTTSVSVNYESADRPFSGGPNYRNMAMAILTARFPRANPTFLRNSLRDHAGHCAATHRHLERGGPKHGYVMTKWIERWNSAQGRQKKLHAREPEFTDEFIWVNSTQEFNIDTCRECLCVQLASRRRNGWKACNCPATISLWSQATQYSP